MNFLPSNNQFLHEKLEIQQYFNILIKILMYKIESKNRKMN